MNITEGKSGLLISEIKTIEPELALIEKYVKTKNEEAKSHIIYWHNVWVACKRMQYHLIGMDAQKYILSSSECWDDWHNHLYELSTNMK